jgi:hypothetical protein
VPSSVQKELKELLRAVEQQGCRVVRTKSGAQIYCPDGETIVTTHNTPGRNAIRHYVRDLKRAFDFEWKGR